MSAFVGIYLILWY